MIEKEKSCVYWIIYSGNKHPQNYIGSVYNYKLSEGYLGSTSSKKWADIVKLEQNLHPELYKLKVIYECDTREEAGIMEGIIQKLYNVVLSDKFWNMSICSNGHIYTCRKGKIPWNPKGSTGIYSEESLKKMSDSKMGIPLHDEDARKHLSIINKGELNAFYGKHHSEYQKDKWKKDRQGTQSKCDNHNANLIHIYNDEHILKFQCNGDFDTVCFNNNLPCDALRKSYSNGDILYQSKKSHPKGKYKKYSGWYAVKINKKEIEYV